MNKVLIACAGITLIFACSYSGGGKRGYNVLESVYLEVVDKDPEAKKLEDMIEVLHDGKADSLAAFENYERKNNSYYKTADTYAELIKDPVIRNRVKDMVAASHKEYDASIANHNGLVKVVDDKSARLEDLHLALKVIKTLPAMRQYQAENLPSTMPIEHYLTQQNAAIKLADMMLKK